MRVRRSGFIGRGTLAYKTLAAIITSNGVRDWSRTVGALDQAVARSRQRALQQARKPMRRHKRGWRKIIKGRTWTRRQREWLKI